VQCGIDIVVICQSARGELSTGRTTLLAGGASLGPRNLTMIASRARRTDAAHHEITGAVWLMLCLILSAIGFAVTGCSD
jgi:hypothetical protein